MMTDNSNKYSREILVGNHKWKVTLNDEEISFYYVRTIVPEIDSIDANFSNFDGNDVGIDPYESYESLGILNLKDVPIMRVKNLIMKNVVTLIGNREFFYFAATSSERLKLYTYLSKSLAKMLPGDWEYEIVGGWFYFRKVTG